MTPTKTKKVKRVVKCWIIVRPGYKKEFDCWKVHAWTPMARQNKGPVVGAVSDNKSDILKLFKDVKCYERDNKIKAKANIIECQITYLA